MVQGQVFLKVGGLALFLCNHLKVIIFTFRNYFILCKIVSDIFFLRIVFEEKKNSATIILREKVIRSCLKMNLKISHELR